MIILIEKEWAIKSNRYGVSLARYFPIAKDPEYYKPTFFYNNYVDALQGFVDKQIGGSGNCNGDFEAIVMWIRKLYRIILEIAPQLPHPTTDIRTILPKTVLRGCRGG